MKKIILLFVSVLFVGVTAMYAQQDTTSADRATQQDKSAPQDQSSQSSNYTKDMTPIQSSDMPAALRSTLQGSRYKGWENGTLYRSKNNDGYALELKDGATTKVFRFDANGKPIQ